MTLAGALTRRGLLATTLAGAVTAKFVGVAGADSAVDRMPIELFDPRRPIRQYFEDYKNIRSAIFTNAGGKKIVARLWQAHKETGAFKYAEWSLLYCYNWWRAVSLGDARVQTSRIGLKMADALVGAFANQPGVAFWKATFLGLESISRGTLETAHLVPEVKSGLELAYRKNPDYLYASAAMALAKLYLKAPPFPISIGDLDVAQRYLTVAEPHQKGVFGLWYLIQAELDYRRNGLEAAKVTLARLTEEIRPVDGVSMYALDTTMVDAQNFIQAIENGTYHKYNWDPLFAPLEVPEFDQLEQYMRPE